MTQEADRSVPHRRHRATAAWCAALVVAGTTVTWQPAAASMRRMLRFMPKS